MAHLNLGYNLGAVLHEERVVGHQGRFIRSSQMDAGCANTAVVIITLSLFLIVAAWIWFTYAVIESPPEERGDTLLTCAPGQCSTNIYNGEKICPTALEGTIQADPKYQACSSPTICDNPLLPYALQDDGSTNSDGICPAGVICRCLSKPQCADYIVSAFQTVNGNPYLGLDGQRTAFIQTNSHSTITGEVSNQPPISYSNPLTTFCTVPVDWLNRATPGCGFAPTMSMDNLRTCMASGRACLVGTLALIPNDPAGWDVSQLERTPLGCVRGEACPAGQVALWDNRLGGVVCRTA